MLKRFLGLVALVAVIGLVTYFTSSESLKNVGDKHQYDIENQMAEEGSRNSDFVGLDPKFEVMSEDKVEYYEGATGYVATPEEEGDYPGVIMIHEWWGLNDNIRDMADMLAAQGYNVLAVDLYGGGWTEDPEVARELATEARDNPEESVANMQAAADYLRDELGVSKLASLGWCFGGQQSLQASLNEDLDATVIYYGNLVTDEEALRSLESPVLGIFGAEDSGIPVSDVAAFETALNNLGVENNITVYDGVGHAFANPTGGNFAPAETQDAWEKTVKFLEDSLK
jgi:carboxymethylenebutenolidase